jgi:hypothetical protein
VVIHVLFVASRRYGVVGRTSYMGPSSGASKLHERVWLVVIHVLFISAGRYVVVGRTSYMGPSSGASKLHVRVW